MGVINTIKRWISMLFEKDIEEQFGVTDITSPEMRITIEKCGRIYRGRPPWIDKEDEVKTINFAKVICSETARLTTLAISIDFDGGARGQWLQSQFDGSYFKLRHWVEYGNAYGTVILKPNGEGIDIFLPGQFIVTSTDARGNIDGIVFKDTYEENEFCYTKYEYHRFIDEYYVITNKAFRSTSQTDKGVKISLEKTKWKGIQPEVTLGDVEAPLFGVYTTAEANNIDIDSPLGMPQFKEGIEELKDLDVAYSRHVEEMFDSKRLIFVDDRVTMAVGQNLKKERSGIKLPKFIKNVFGNDKKEFYQEVTPQLNPEQRIAGINNILDFIGYKAGYSNGYFRFDGKTGMVTATQVEADDRRTIQLIKDHRDRLEDCIKGVTYALNVFADLYKIAPVGRYEVNLDFGDITYNHEEDKLTWWKYRIQNDIPAWYYYVKFEGMTEEDAKKLIKEAQIDAPTLFEEE